ncbi:MAG: hypothetical protein ACU837_01890 [Gammaproteobacteria bacterium]
MTGGSAIFLGAAAAQSDNNESIDVRGNNALSACPVPLPVIKLLFMV